MDGVPRAAYVSGYRRTLQPSPSALMKHLKEHGGIYGLSVASDYEVMFPSGIEVEPKTVATGTESLEFLTYVSAQLLWYITGHTWDVCNYIHTLLNIEYG